MIKEWYVALFPWCKSRRGLLLEFTSISINEKEGYCFKYDMFVVINVKLVGRWSVGDRLERWSIDDLLEGWIFSDRLGGILAMLGCM